MPFPFIFGKGRRPRRDPRSTLGWLSWLGLHLVFLIGFRNRLIVFVNWVWNYFTWDRGNRVIISSNRAED